MAAFASLLPGLFHRRFPKYSSVHFGTFHSISVRFDFMQFPCIQSQVLANFLHVRRVVVSCVIFTSTCLVRSIKAGRRQASQSFHDVIHKSILPMETFVQVNHLENVTQITLEITQNSQVGEQGGIAIHLLLF